MPFTRENVTCVLHRFWKSLFLPVLTRHHHCRTNYLVLLFQMVKKFFTSVPSASTSYFQNAHTTSSLFQTFSPMVHDSLCVLLLVSNNMFLGSKYSSGFQPRNTFFCVEDDFAVVIESSYMTDQFKFSLLCPIHASQVESLRHVHNDAGSIKL